VRDLWERGVIDVEGLHVVCDFAVWDGEEEFGYESHSSVDGEKVDLGGPNEGDVLESIAVGDEDVLDGVSQLVLRV
jgi:hypothetical protein